MDNAKHAHHSRSPLLMEPNAMTQDALKTNSQMRMVTATHALQEPSEALMENPASGQTDPCSKPIQTHTRLHT
jgi:hypothetical protein